METNCYNVSHIQRPFDDRLHVEFCKKLSTDCTLIPILPGNFLRTKFGRFKNIEIFAKTQRI
jgi:hypothetical protein